MLTFNDWLTILNSTQLGRIWWANLQFDVDKHNIDAALEAEFRNEVELYLARSSGTVSPMEIIDHIVRDKPDRFDLKCARIPITDEPYSRVLSLTVFALHNIRWSDLGLETDEGTNDRVWDWLGTIVTNIHYTGVMMTQRPFFWCSPTRSVRRIQSACRAGDEASEVRNQLGLYHVDKDQRLLRVDIPEYILNGKVIRAPTTLDAGANVVFTPCDDARGIGWTLNLTSLDKGVEEIVIESLPFNSDYIVTKVGIVSDPLPPINWHTIEMMAVGR